MFAYRRAHQESTRFLPFKLLYGRNMHGPMSILRELWTNEMEDNEVKDVQKYSFQLRNRTEDTCNIAAQYDKYDNMTIFYFLSTFLKVW